ncbi:MAG TPA: DUF4351 domain-containing protein [Thermoanaerobaculia bacterium]|nr:DUF4351 domain-containing protein [Thermoanaerobaculia bacterium]
MTDHDQFFKNLLQEFFGDLLRIVAPELAVRLRVEEPTFLESELFSSFPEGRRRYLDLVARVTALEGEPEVVLVHVEIERQARKTMGLRLLDYAMQLWLEHHQPVVPIVVYLRGGKPDVTREEVRIDVVGQSFFSFSYLAFGLSRSQAVEYLARPEPLAWGLAALMKRGAMSPGRHRVACLSPMTTAKLSDRKRFLLVNCVETYVQLDDAAQEEYDALLAGEGYEEVATMEMTWADRLRQEGFEAGKRDLLLEQLERRFGPLPQTTVQRVSSLTSSDELSRLAARVLDAPSLDDLGL